MELFVWLNFVENYFKLIIFKLSHLLSCSLNYFSDPSNCPIPFKYGDKILSCKSTDLDRSEHKCLGYKNYELRF